MFRYCELRFRDDTAESIEIFSTGSDHEFSNSEGFVSVAGSIKRGESFIAVLMAGQNDISPELRQVRPERLHLHVASVRTP